MKNVLQKITKQFSVIVIFMLYVALAAAQTTITGKVTDANDATPLPGVTVTVKGTTTSVQTDAGGNYSIVAPSNATLVFSSASFTSRELPVSGQNNFDVSLSAANARLNEVVIVAYGARRRGDLTGAVTSVSA